MTVSRKELLTRRLAFWKITNELGLPPPPTSPTYDDWSPQVMDSTASPIVKALTKDNPADRINKWVVSPATIKSAPTDQSKDAAIIINFLETAQTVNDLAKEIHDKVEGDPEKGRKIAVIVGRCIDEHPGAKASGAKFSDITTDKVKSAIKATAAHEWKTSKRTPASIEARLAIADCINQCDKLKLNDPTKSKSPGNWANCSVHTVFVHAATHNEGFGGPDTSLFLNYMPNHVISRAIPILNVTIDLPDGLEKRKLIQSLGPSLFLDNPIGLKKNPGVDAAFTKTLDGNPDDPNLPRRSVGNDTFNLPQTLGPSRVRSIVKLNELDPLPVNKFSPLGAIESFEFNFDGGSLSDLMTREAARGTMVLSFPDKTKISGLDQLLIGTNGLLSMSIEFGWSVMPDQLKKQADGTTAWIGSQDPLMTYMNEQKIRIGCTTTLNSIDFTDSGVVKVTLGLLDPANEDKIKGPGVSDVADYMPVYNKTSPRFIDLILKVLAKDASKATDDIAEQTGYRRTISKVLAPAKKRKLNKREKKQVLAYDKAKKVLHYKIDHLAEIKKGTAFKGGDLILDQINTIESTNMDEVKGYEYLYFDLTKADSGAAKFLTALVEDIESTMADRPKLKKKYGKGVSKKLQILSDATGESVVYLKPPEGRKIPDRQKWQKIFEHATSLYKTHQGLAKRYEVDNSSWEIWVKSTLGINQTRMSLMTGTKRSEILNLPQIKEGTITIPLSLPTGEPMPESANNKFPWLHMGKVKLNYPPTLTPPMTKAQQKKRNVNQNAANKSAPKELSAISGRMLKEARNGYLYWSYTHILSSGYTLYTKDKPGPEGKRIFDPLDGSDAAEKALALEPKADPDIGLLGGIAKWWYENKTASQFIPFSHLVHFSLVQSLYASGKYDEIQVIYFKMNNSCGRMSGMNIGDTPIAQDSQKHWDAVSSAFAFINRILSKEINTSKSKTPYGFKHAEKKVKKGKKVIKNLIEGQTVPSVKYATRTVMATDPNDPKSNRKILKLTFYDETSTIDEGAGQRVVNSMRDDGRTTALSNVQTTNTKNSEAIRKKMLAKALNAAGVIKEQTPESALGEKSILVGPDTYRVIKSAIKAAHPHINYGAAGSAVLRGSVSGKMTGTEQMDVFAKSMKTKQNTSAAGRHNAMKAGKAPDIALTEVIGASRTVDLEMVGCPMLQVGSLYFIDFYTDTDIDNFYLCKKVSHKIDGNKFTTTATFMIWDSGGRVTIAGDVDGFERLMAEDNTVNESS